MELLGRWLRGVCALAALFLTSGCSHVSYLVQAGVGQWSLYNHERPLGEVIADPRTKSEVRERLEWIPEIKKIVEADLEVKATSNYTTYVQLDRPYVIWSLTAAERYELKTVDWKFPIVGAFPYLGFFKEATAQDWAKEYTERGFDTYVRGVGAYSTLGYLRDPLLSSMLSRKKADLVNLIYHESTHGQIYLKGQGSFNEQVASFIGDAGEKYWILKTYGESSPEFAQWKNDRADRRRFGQMLRQFAEELKAHYEQTREWPELRRSESKLERFAVFQKRLESEPWKGVGYARASRLVRNNAGLLAFLTYEDEQELFDLVEAKSGGRLKDALRYLKSFAEEWDRLKSNKPGATPQSMLKERLLGERPGNAAGAVGLDTYVH